MLPRRFYETYIKPCKKLRLVDLPSVEPDKEIRIEKTLLDWRIYYTPLFKKKEQCISCKSELEAKYLAVWLKYDVNSIGVPTDEEDLAKVVPLLEKLEQKVKAVLDEDLVGYSRKVQRQVTQGIWEVATQ